MVNKSLRIMVTGSAGFIGSTFCYKALSLNHQILGLDNYSNSSEERSIELKKYFHKNFSFLEIDLAKQKEQLEEAMKIFKPDLIVHFAGLKSVSESKKNPNKYWSNNVDSTMNILGAMERTSVKKIIFSSSAAVYGNSNDQPVNESSLINPSSVYGETKQKCEEIIKEFSDKKIVDAVVLRFFNLCGCHKEALFFENPRTSESLMSEIIKVSLGYKENLIIFGKNFHTRDGTPSRDFIHIEDLIEALMLLINDCNIIKKYEIYNLGTGKDTTVLELVDDFIRINKVKINYKSGNPKKEDIDKSYSNPLKFYKKTGWKAKKDIKDICIDSWKPFLGGL